MKLKPTLLALLLAGGIHAHAVTPHEAAWSALVAAKKADAPASAEALTIKGQILAAPNISLQESLIVGTIASAHGGQEAYQAAFRTIASGNKTGEGALRAIATVKFWDGEMTGWTEEMLQSRYDLASVLANRPAATPEFRQQVWNVIKTRPAVIGPCRVLFKSMRSILPIGEQIAVTQVQKRLLLAIPTRDAAANAWLAEVSADLIALQLDQ